MHPPESASRRGTDRGECSPDDAWAGGGYGGHDFESLAARAQGPIGGTYMNPGVGFDVWGNSDKQVHIQIERSELEYSST